MNTVEFMRLAINLHARTVVGLIDAAERAGTPKQRAERLAMARDAVLEFKTDMCKALKDEPERKEQLRAYISPEEAEEDFQRRALDEEQPEQWEDDLVAAIAALPKPT